MAFHSLKSLAPKATDMALTFCRMAVTLALTGFISFNAIADDNDRILAEESKDICSQGGQSTMNICMAKEYKKADLELNTIYSKLTETLQSPEGVKNAERAWIKYRDAECSNDIFQLPRPNSLSPLVETACKRTLTLERIERLKKQLRQNCNGCPPRK